MSYKISRKITKKSKAKKPENPLKQNQTSQKKQKRKKVKNKNKTKSSTNFSEYFTPRGLISFYLFVREDLT